MTAFTKENLVKHGCYVMYTTPENPRGRFVARFKRGRSGIATFMTHLRKKWTVEDYFAAEDAGLAPLQIVAKTDYLQPHIKKELKREGYPLTTAGKMQLIRDQSKARDARLAAQTPKFVERPDGNGFIRAGK